MVAFYAIPCRKTQETWECCFERCSTISLANRYITIKYWKLSNILHHLLLFNAWTWTLQNLRYVISIAAFTGPQTKTRSSPERIGGLILKQIRKCPSWKWAVTFPSRYVVIQSYIFMFSPFGLIWDDLGMVKMLTCNRGWMLPRRLARPQLKWVPFVSHNAIYWEIARFWERCRVLKVCFYT